MADECLTAIPEIEGIDYTVQEFLEMIRHLKQAQLKLGEEFSLHRIELTLWTHNVLLSLKPELLAGVPEDGGKKVENKNGNHGNEDSMEEAVGYFGPGYGEDSNEDSNLEFHGNQ